MMVGLAGASGFSPSSLVFNLEPNQEECQMIIITSASETISVNDYWAENENVTWKVSLFNSSAGEHNLNIIYDNSLGEGERELQVCLSGSELGEYHGVIIMKEEQQGNSVVQMGVWLKVVIEEVEEIVEEPVVNNEGSGGRTSQTIFIPKENTTVETSGDLENLDEVESESSDIESSEEEFKSGITGAAVGLLDSKGSVAIISLVVLVVIAVGVYVRRNK